MARIAKIFVLLVALIAVWAFPRLIDHQGTTFNLKPVIVDLPPPTITAYFVGDMMLDRGVLFSINKNYDGDFSKLFDDLGFLATGDFVFGNLEGPASDKGYDLGNLWSFRMLPEVITVLKNAGFNILSLANNHAGDWGREAFHDTVDRLQAGDILPVGVFADNQDTSSVIQEIKGIKFGWLGFTDLGPKWLAEGDGPIIGWAGRGDLLEVIKEAAEKVDVLIVSFHFGDEYQPLPNVRQKYLAETAIDSGAKIVIGHHPHVVQPTEFYNDGLIAYSLGNFVFDQYFSDETMTGKILKIEFEGEKIKTIEEIITKQDETYKPWVDDKEKGASH